MALLRDFRHTKIFTSHDLDMVFELCERTIVLHEGTVRADGPTREIFSNELLLDECRLEKPFSMQNCAFCHNEKSSA
jgi:cobalt/nickel transport system ATP-binding protein